MKRLGYSIAYFLMLTASALSHAQAGWFRGAGMPLGMAVQNYGEVLQWLAITNDPSEQTFYTTVGLTAEINAVINGRVVGTQFQLGYKDIYTEVGGTITVYIVAHCTSGDPASLSALTTVATIDAFGNMTATDVPTNPQCRDGCVISAPVGLPAGYQCLAYRNPTVSFAVGVAVWTSCLGSVATPVTKSGETCNSAGTDYGTMSPSPAQPLGYALVVPAPPSGGGTGGIDKAVDITSVCTDANGNGIDDITGVTCSVQAATALKGVRDAKTTEMTDIGKSGDLGAEVGALSNNNGGWFNVPQKLLDVLSPTPACALEFVMPNLAFMPTSTISFTGWCAVYTVVEPYFAFLMWLTTVLVLMSLWRKV